MDEKEVKKKGSGKKGGGAKKYSRNRMYCKLYAARGLHDRNKARRLIKTLRRQPNNTQVHNALRALDAISVKDAVNTFYPRYNWTKILQDGAKALR